MERNLSIEVKALCLGSLGSLATPFQLYRVASIGNFFLTGARLFLGSVDASTFLRKLLLRIGRCSPLVHVIPCINTNHTHHISALLTNGEMITGQSQISHPSKSVPKDNSIAHSAKFIHLLGSYDDHLKILLDDEDQQKRKRFMLKSSLSCVAELKNSQFLCMHNLVESQILLASVKLIDIVYKLIFLRR
ncbi:AKR_collapsed_G0047300.mRNA.1.CDS.1 [Saccharomyces cerevisiae]|nr:AKR_collapsed_G0047300.mRNA.1.CDS.1 [Saccharomyces cerevisiae]